MKCIPRNTFAVSEKSYSDRWDKHGVFLERVNMCWRRSISRERWNIFFFFFAFFLSSLFPTHRPSSCCSQGVLLLPRGAIAANLTEKSHCVDFNIAIIYQHHFRLFGCDRKYLGAPRDFDDDEFHRSCWRGWISRERKVGKFGRGSGIRTNTNVPGECITNQYGISCKVPIQKKEEQDGSHNTASLLTIECFPYIFLKTLTSLDSSFFPETKCFLLLHRSRERQNHDSASLACCNATSSRLNVVCSSAILKIPAHLRRFEMSILGFCNTRDSWKQLPQELLRAISSLASFLTSS
ncbi:hypothetical protein CEXT_366881 [Caerostris extrusa]|uniref:Uncharacterized protein n=1 Tax=Caerostris extrusa TaxID=172846 RepID=A0AAV4W663_CAEEX|nr:hypothetical protein CEXT_366881 [Caerostris extrusa]